MFTRSHLTAVVVALGLLALPAVAQAGQTAGVQTHLLWGDVTQAEMERQLDLVRASGASMTRVDVGWASLQERGPGGFHEWHLGRLDRLVDAAEARGVKLLLTLMNTPCWASTAPETEKQGCAGSWWERDVTRYAPADPMAYARALAFLVERYGDRVFAWEIWNEPNHTGFWVADDPARAYVALVKAAYAAAKAADPSATIVAGSLSQSDYRFAQRLYDLGIRGSFDAFSIHPYSDDVSPLDERSYTDARYSFARGVPAVREVMVRNGDGAVPLWLAESGWSTSTVRGQAAHLNGVSEADQARYLREQASLIERWSYVKVSIWFNLVDRGANRASKWDNCGLWRVDGTAKPAWAALREAARALASDEQTVTPPAPGGGVSAAPGGQPAPPGGSPPAPTGSSSPAPTGSAPSTARPAASKAKRRLRSRRKRARARARRAAARRAALRRRLDAKSM
jgi:hypothetical protein